jgi:hypothetical protein
LKADKWPERNALLARHFALFTEGYRTNSIETLNPEYYFNEYEELLNIVNIEQKK